VKARPGQSVEAGRDLSLDCPRLGITPVHERRTTPADNGQNR
jgi:hypothetical protein